MPRIALATVAAARDLDDDIAPLSHALRTAGCDVQLADWDDPGIDWSQFDAVLLRSTWDYAQRLPEFLDWCTRISSLTRLLNPLHVVRWNTDKHYLRDLAEHGIATVESHFIEPDQAPDNFPDFEEFVVKPAVGAGSRDTQRYRRQQRPAAIAHIRQLLKAQRAALIQPYLAQVDSEGETALIFFDGEFSHAIRKAPLLQPDQGPTQALFAPEDIRPRQPGPAELSLARHIIAILPFGPLTYARVDLLPSAHGPRLLELELTEPSLFLQHTTNPAAQHLTSAILRQLGG